MNLGSVAEWNAFSHGKSKELTKLCQDLANGLSVDAFGGQMHDVLLRGHSGSWLRGKARSRRDPLVSLSPDDVLRVRDVHDLEGDYLAGFLDDLDRGRYTKADGSLDRAAIERRARMYGQRFRGTTNEAFVETSPDDDQFRWVLGVAEHCSGCLEMADLSPFSKDELWTYPGAGDLDCVTNCRCHIERVSDGLAGFRAS